MFKLFSCKDLHILWNNLLFSGFLTSKGELVRAILYPKPVDFRFNKDTYFFVGVLGLIAAVGLVYTVILKVCGYSYLTTCKCCLLFVSAAYSIQVPWPYF